MSAQETSNPIKFDCSGCGADLVFQPGTTSLQCPYCGRQNTIAESQEQIEELGYDSHLKNAGALENTAEIITVRCTACGAETTLPPNITSDNCAFCGTPLVISSAHSVRILKPKAVLPFKIPIQEGRQRVSVWINALWFAPTKLKLEAEKDKLLKGMYLPYWTYDCSTASDYRGERGEHYLDTEIVTVNGKRERRQVQKTRWYPASGHVDLDFDDVLILGSHSLPKNYADQLEPWDLANLVPYQEHYLAGFRAESYQVNLEQGFAEAKQIMSGQIHSACARNIGGDEQRVHNVNTAYSDITFKHILLPVWIGAYRYRGKVYQFQVNARTGEVQGSRPYSWVKITLAILAVLLIILLIASLGQQ